MGSTQDSSADPSGDVVARRFRYDRRDLPGDLFAGLTLWAVFAAQALAYSRLAHSTPTAGLMTAVAGAAIYSALGSSRRVSIGPAGGIAAMVGAAVVGIPAHALGASLAALTLLAAGFLLAAGLARISFLPRLFPVPVFVGYIAGTGVTIIFGQARDLLSGGTLALLVGLAAIAAVLALKRWAPRLPGPFIVLLAATVAGMALHLGARGVPVIGSQLGHFGALTVPAALGWSGVRPLLGPAFGLALIVYVDALANSDLLAQAGDPPTRPRREYFALGAVNAISGLLGGFMAGCSTSRSLLGVRSGERTRLAPALAALLLLLSALSIVRFLAPLPLPALAGVVLIAALDLIDVKRLLQFWRLRRADFWTALCAAIAVVAFGMTKGVAIGVVGALAEALRRSMQPDRGLFSTRLGAGHLYEPFTPDAVRAGHGLLIYRFGAPLFFGNADVFRDDMRLIARTGRAVVRTVVINADALGIPDATARDVLLKAQKELAAEGIQLVFGNARAPLRAALDKVGAFTLIDESDFAADMRLVNPAIPPLDGAGAGDQRAARI
jgi:sulfate permease, SulP family